MSLHEHLSTKQGSWPSTHSAFGWVVISAQQAMLSLFVYRSEHEHLLVTPKLRQLSSSWLSTPIGVNWSWFWTSHSNVRTYDAYLDGNDIEKASSPAPGGWPVTGHPKCSRPLGGVAQWLNSSSASVEGSSITHSATSSHARIASIVLNGPNY